MRKQDHLKSTPKVCIEVGARISVIMSEKRISNRELADRTGIDAGDISRYRSGRMMAKLLTLERIAVGLGVGTADLFCK